MYGLCVQPIVKEFLSKAKLNCKYLFSIITYGFYDGAATKDLIKTGNKYGIEISYINTLKMVENYLPQFNMKSEVKKCDNDLLDKKISNIVNEIKDKKKFIHKDSLFDSFMTWTHIKNMHIIVV